MNSAALEPVGWKAPRLFILLVLIFGSQFLLIFLLSSRSPLAPSPIPTISSIQLFTEPVDESEFAKTFLANDPTLFAMANPHGFSGAAWLKVSERNYDLSERVESPFWLPINSERLGSVVSQFIRTNAVVPVSVTENISPKIFASSLLDLPDNVKTNSELRIEGDLASRALFEFPQLQSWVTNDILSNTVVQISVDNSGTVISPRILSRSGSTEADRAALEQARELRFTPNGKVEATWGKLFFDWHTVALTPTNSPSGIPK